MKFINSFTGSIKKILALSLAAALILATASSCAQDEVETFNESAAAAASELPMPASVTEGFTKDQMVVAMPEAPATFYPFALQDETMSSILSLVFEPAIRLDASDKSSPSIIESWEIDASGCQYTFHIRHGVAFHGDYGEVSADDLIFCLDTIKNMDAAVCPYTKYITKVESYSKIDDDTIALKTTEKTGDILYLMTFPVVPRSYYANQTDTSLKIPVGTGPYRAVSYSKNEGIVFEVNEDWWKTLPKIKSIVARPLAKKDIVIGGEALEEYDCIMIDDITANSFAAEGKTTVHSVITPNYDCLIPNINNRFLKDPSVRKAISIALNRSEIISKGLLGEGQATETPLYSGLWYFEDMGTTGNGHNIAETKQLLDDAGYAYDKTTGKRFVENSDGTKGFLRLKLLYTESPAVSYRKTVCETISQQLADIGIEVELVEATDVDEYKKKLTNQEFDLALCSFYTKTNNDVSFFFSDEYNFGGFAGDFSAELNACNTAVTAEERKAAFSALQLKWLQEIPSIGLYFRENAVIMNAEIQMNTKMRFKSIFLDIGEWS